MTRRIQIASLNNARIANEIRVALRNGLDTDRIADFLANVDWSGAEKAANTVRDRLGVMEAWSTGFAEGEITRSGYVARLLSLLPKKERTLRLVMGSGDIVTTELGDPLVARRSPAAPAPQGHQVVA